MAASMASPYANALARVVRLQYYLDHRKHKDKNMTQGVHNGETDCMSQNWVQGHEKIEFVNQVHAGLLKYILVSLDTPLYIIKLPKILALANSSTTH